MTQHKSERKNNRKTAVIVTLLLALVALLCFGGYTFSKYVTHGNGTGTANVAKWGYNVNVDTSGIFGEKYKKVAGDFSTITTAPDGLSVKAESAGRKLVAPGTTGSMIFSVGGKSEVRSRLYMGITPNKDVVLKIKKGEGAEIVYNPVKWTLKKNGNIVSGAENVTLIDIANKLNHEPVSVGGTYEAGTELPETTYELSWAWAFEGTEAFTGITVNELDTILGQRADKEDFTYAGWTINEAVTSIEFVLDIKVEQLAS
mgnify:FL=1